MNFKLIITVIIFCLSSLFTVQAESLHIQVQGQSFAEEYGHLRKLLSQVQSRESALAYKSQITAELDRLKSSQVNGGQAFAALSADEQQMFIRKFQNNQFHCGEVTQVMEERRRILLDPDLSEVLGTVIKDIP